MAVLQPTLELALLRLLAILLLGVLDGLFLVFFRHQGEIGGGMWKPCSGQETTLQPNCGGVL